MHEINLISDLGVVLLCAALVALVFQRFKLPVFLGYLLSGVLVGPNLFSSSPVHDLDTVHALSELGVIFLMFYIGMEFDLRRLRQVFGSVILALLLEAGFFIILGLQLAPILGWGIVEGFFLGALLAISSSMVTVAILKDLDRMDKPHAQLAVGVLILEDILAVLLLVILTGVAVSGKLELGPVLKVTFFIAVFVVVVYLLGKIAANHFLNFLHKINNTELITLSAIAWVLGVSILAQQFDFSLALGAFLAGSILSQSKLVHEVEAATEPMRNIFCAVFFVSAGMLIQPGLFVAEWKVILGVSFLVFFVKIATVWLGLVVTGQKTDTSFRAAMTKAQIGEFSFIIAGLGQALGVTSDSLMTIAVGVSVLTTIMSLMGSVKVDWLYGQIAERLPEPITVLGRFYQNVLTRVRQSVKRNILLTLIKRPLVQITVNFFLIHGIIIGAYLLVEFIKDFEALAVYGPIVVMISWFATALICLPLGIAVIRNMNAIILIVTDVIFSNNATKQYLQGRFRNIFHGIIVTVVWTIVCGFYFSMTAQYLSSGAALILYFLLFCVVAFALWRQMIKFNSHLEMMFMETFNQRYVDDEELDRERTLNEITDKYPWPVDIREIKIEPGTFACGKTLVDLKLRDQAGVMVVAISRSGILQYDPGAYSMIFPLDKLYVLGSQIQIDKARKTLLEPIEITTEASQIPSFEIEKLYLGNSSTLVDKTLIGADLRNQYGITVVGIQRGEKRITSPSPNEILEVGDVLYAIGDKASIEKMKEAIST